MRDVEKRWGQMCGAGRWLQFGWVIWECDIWNRVIWRSHTMTWGAEHSRQGGQVMQRIQDQTVLDISDQKKGRVSCDQRVRKNELTEEGRNHGHYKESTLFWVLCTLYNIYYNIIYIHIYIYIYMYIYKIQKYKEEIGVPGWLNRLSIWLLLSAQVMISRFVSSSPGSGSALTMWSLRGILSLCLGPLGTSLETHPRIQVHWLSGPKPGLPCLVILGIQLVGLFPLPGYSCRAWGSWGSREKSVVGMEWGGGQNDLLPILLCPRSCDFRLWRTKGRRVRKIRVSVLKEEKEACTTLPLKSNSENRIELPTLTRPSVWKGEQTPWVWEGTTGQPPGWSHWHTLYPLGFPSQAFALFIISHFILSVHSSHCPLCLHPLLKKKKEMN